MPLVKMLFDALASYLLAAVLLTLLLALTFFGTVAQVDQGLYEVTNTYFGSLVVVHWLFDRIPLPLPGGYLLMSLLFVNLLCGAIVRAPKRIRHPGMLIAHGGILFMLVAGFVTYQFSTNGRMLLFEGQSASRFQDYFDWELVVTDLGEGGKQYVIAHAQLMAMDPERPNLFHAEGLPFDIMLEGFERNCAPRRATPGIAEGIDGIVLDPRPLEAEAETNVAGVYATLIENAGKPGGAHGAMGGGMGSLRPHLATLWGMANAPWLVRVADRDYAIDLRHRTYPVPFTITLDKFIRDLHPRTTMAANFESVVTKTQAGAARQVEIKMNEPLRHQGYTFFQASWGPEGAAPGEPLFSVFAVVKNPADQWPLYSCLVIAAGLLIHFVQKLLGYLRAENRRRAAV